MTCSRALGEYVRAADLLPDDRALQVTAGNYLLSARRFDEAKARAELVLAQEPKHVEAQVLLGNSLAGLRNIDQAISEIEEAIKIDPLRGATYANLGLLEMERGKADAAERAFKRSVELEPKWVPGHLALANHYWATGKTAEAEAWLRTALDLEPANPVTNRAHGRVLRRHEQTGSGGAVRQGARRLRGRAVRARGFLPLEKPSGQRDTRASATARVGADCRHSRPSTGAGLCDAR